MISLLGISVLGNIAFFWWWRQAEAESEELARDIAEASQLKADLAHSITLLEDKLRIECYEVFETNRLLQVAESRYEAAESKLLEIARLADTNTGAVGSSNKCVGV